MLANFRPNACKHVEVHPTYKNTWIHPGANTVESRVSTPHQTTIVDSKYTRLDSASGHKIRICVRRFPGDCAVRSSVTNSILQLARTHSLQNTQQDTGVNYVLRPVPSPSRFEDSAREEVIIVVCHASAYTSTALSYDLQAAIRATIPEVGPARWHNIGPADLNNDSIRSMPGVCAIERSRKGTIADRTRQPHRTRTGAGTRQVRQSSPYIVSHIQMPCVTLYILLRFDSQVPTGTSVALASSPFAQASSAPSPRVGGLAMPPSLLWPS